MTTRRSVLKILASVPFISVLLAPRESVAKAEKALPTCRNLSHVFKEIRTFVKQHPGATVLSADDPRNRSIGWSAYKTYYSPNRASYEVNLYCTIKLDSLKSGKALLGFTPAQQEWLRGALRSVKGRQELAKALMKPDW